MIGLAQFGEAVPALTMLGVLLGIVLAAGGVLMWVRARTLGGRSGSGGGGLFEDLARMKDAGEISDEEYAAAKRSVVDRMAGQMGSGKAGPIVPRDAKPIEAGDGGSQDERSDSPE